MDSQDTHFDVLRYDLWLEEALQSVVRRALVATAEHGLADEHHFYITFDTQADGVDMPGHLRAQHPEDMTIVLQHQFESLTVGDDAFEVTLRFGGRPSLLHIPFAAITSFADPSVNFGLQMRMVNIGDGIGDDDDFDDRFEDDDGTFDVDTLDATGTSENDDDADAADADDMPGTAEVIALDAFRKK